MAVEGQVSTEGLEEIGKAGQSQSTKASSGLCFASY